MEVVLEKKIGSGIPAPSKGDLPWASPREVAATMNQPYMLTADQFSKQFHVTIETINAWRNSGKVIGVADAKHGYRYPSWQMDERGKPYEAIERIIHELAGDHWAAWQFLEEIVPEVGEVGFHALARGRNAELLSTLKARSYGSFS